MTEEEWLLRKVFPDHFKFRARTKRILAQNIPHRVHSKSEWCWPVWWCWFFGGHYDSGNGYGWYPGIKRRFQCYYKEKWYEAGYTIWSWLQYPTFHDCSKKQYVKKHGLW